jgi:hypothetical protein
MSRVPTFVVDYPEAHAAMRHLTATTGVLPAGVLQAHGRVPNADTLAAHPLPDEPFIVVNGSGDYHHETVTFLEAFVKRHAGKRFTYIQIDAHPDKDDTYRWKLDCASFVGRVMERDEIERVYLLGLYPECLDTHKTGNLVIHNLSYFRVPYLSKLHQYLVGETTLHETMHRLQHTSIDDASQNESIAFYEELSLPRPGDEKKPAKLREGPMPALRVQWKTLADFDARRDLPDLPVYLTIDLDVARSKIVTDWRRDPSVDDVTTWGTGDNQGNMEWDVLLALVRRIGAARPILGADFCGLTHTLEEISDEARASSLDAVHDIYGALVDAIASRGK